MDDGFLLVGHLQEQWHMMNPRQRRESLHRLLDTAARAQENRRRVAVVCPRSLPGRRLGVRPSVRGLHSDARRPAMPTSRRWFWLILLLAAGPAAADWPTLHKDYQRSGYSGEVLRGPMQRKWFRSFVEEMVGPRAEAIVAEGLCFVGTYAGNLHALNVDDGQPSGHYQADGPIGHSPCYCDGKLYFCTDAGFEAGSLVCLSARDGKPALDVSRRGRNLESPACDGRGLCRRPRRRVSCRRCGDRPRRCGRCRPAA